MQPRGLNGQLPLFVENVTPVTTFFQLDFLEKKKRPCTGETAQVLTDLDEVFRQRTNFRRKLQYSSNVVVFAIFELGTK